MRALSLILLLTACTGSLPASEDHDPCDYTYQGWCACKGPQNKMVWSRNGDYCDYYESCTGRKHMDCLQREMRQKQRDAIQKSLGA